MDATSPRLAVLGAGGKLAIEGPRRFWTFIAAFEGARRLALGELAQIAAA